MRQLPIVFVTLACALPLRADLLITAETKIVMTGNVPKEIPAMVRDMESVVVMKLKGDRISLHAVPTNHKLPVDITTITDMNTGEIFQIDHVAKTYYVQTRAEQERFATMVLKEQEKRYGAAPKERPVAKPTGKKAELNGHEVEEFVAETPKAHYTYWVARDLQRYVPIAATKLVYVAGPVGVMLMAWQPDPAKLPGIALRTITELPQDGYVQIATTTIQSIKELTLDAEDFSPPGDYKRLERPTLPGLR